MMMTIAHAINDVVLVVLKTPEILESVGISQEKFFTKVLGYDETGLWVQFPSSSCRCAWARSPACGSPSRCSRSTPP